MPVLFIGAIIGIIVSAFVSVASSVVSVLSIVVPIFVQVFGVIRSVVTVLGRNAGTFFRWIARGARSLLNDVIIPAIDSLQAYYDRFKAWLRVTFDPIIRIFDAVQRVMNKIWDKVIGPILDIFDKVRAALRLLAKLGVPFAAKLEGILRKISQTIFERFRQVQTWINTATFWLDILLDPRGFIRSTPFLFSIFRFSGNIVNLITKFADISGFHRERIVQVKAENPTAGVDVVSERFKSGEIGKTFGVQNVAARFRSGTSGRVA